MNPEEKLLIAGRVLGKSCKSFLNDLVGAFGDLNGFLAARPAHVGDKRVHCANLGGRDLGQGAELVVVIGGQARRPDCISLALGEQHPHGL